MELDWKRDFNWSHDGQNSQNRQENPSENSHSWQALPLFRMSQSKRQAGENPRAVVLFRLCEKEGPASLVKKVGLELAIICSPIKCYNGPFAIFERRARVAP
jgi:hypothetical protein